MKAKNRPATFFRSTSLPVLLLSLVLISFVVVTLIFNFGLQDNNMSRSNDKKHLSTLQQRSRLVHDKISELDSHVSESLREWKQDHSKPIDPSSVLKQISSTSKSELESRYQAYLDNIPSSLEKRGISYDLNRPSDYILGKDGDRDPNLYYHAMEYGFGNSTILLIIASNRPEYLQRIAVPIVVSEDGKNSEVARVVQSAIEVMAEIAPTIRIVHIHHPPLDYAENGYIKLSAHFKWALTEVFNNPFRTHFNDEIKRVIILEEDLQIAPDFFEYFLSLSKFLDTDPSVLAVSAWNDNGQKEFIKDPSAIYRSDFFPGLGWMMARHVWEELSPKWPKGYWDDWLREPPQRKGRHVFHPEICRTLHYGVHGVSNSQYNEYLTKIHLNDIYVKFLDMDLSYLEKNTWDENYISSVELAPIISTDSFHRNSYAEVSIRYNNLENDVDSFVSIAKWAGIMDNIKANVPRTAYKGIVSVWKNGVKLHVAPKSISDYTRRYLNTQP